MHLDVVDLKAFYHRSALGRGAQRVIRAAVMDFWPGTRGMTVVGFGFPTPVLRPFLAQSRRVISLMPAQQGVLAWPEGGPNISVMVEEGLWPLQTGLADRLVVMHGLETSDHPDLLLDEIWRVLAPGGRVVFVLPNRAGLWARRDITPFGHGRPYSLGQIETQLRAHRFQPERHRAVLFAPPSARRFWLRTAPLLERLGGAVGARLAGGVLLVEACKQVHAPTRPGLPEALRRPLGVLEGMSTGRPKPASGRQGRPYRARFQPATGTIGRDSAPLSPVAGFRCKHLN